jgi:hypothetical protein
MDQSANSLMSQAYVDKGGSADKIHFHREFGGNLVGDDDLFERMREMDISIAIFTFGVHAYKDDNILKYWKEFTELIHSPQMI